MRPGPVVVSAAVLTAAAVSGGCSLGARQAMADTVIRAADAASLAKTLTGTLAAEVLLVKTKRPAPLGPPRILPVGVKGLFVAADLSTSTTFVGRAGAPTLVFVGSTVLQRRGTVPASLQAAGSAAATNLVIVSSAVADTPASAAKPVGRPWIKLDYNRLPRTSQERTAGSLGVDPGRLVRLLRGALAGSLRVRGTDDFGDQRVTHYAMNLSREKASRGLPNNERILFEKIFDANAVEGDISKAEVWIDPEGRPRRMLVRLRQRLDSITAADLIVTIDVSSFGTPITMDPPKKRDIATVASFGELVHAATGV